MKINRIEIDNFKSIKRIEFLPNDGVNAFIGSNSTGKSNIFTAINWLLGPTYPTFNNTPKADHYLGREENRISISLSFDNGNTLELAEEWADPNGYIKSGLNLNSGYCKNEIREQYCAAYLGIDRKILDHMASNRWSLTGRILQEVNKKFLSEEYEHRGQKKLKSEWLKKWLTYARDTLLFSVKDEDGNELMKRFISILQTESAKQLNRPSSDLRVDMNIYDPWNFYRTLQLIIIEEETEGLELSASEMGMGVQASLSVAILKAYAELNLATNCPIFIDEPELFLHPQAQRNFFNILRDLSEDKYDRKGKLIRKGTQIFYTTHSPNFLSAGKFNEIFIVRKSKEKGTYLSVGDTNKFIKDLKIRKNVITNESDLLLRYKVAFENTGDSQKANEGFFAKKIIIVEGQSEALLLPYFFDLINFDFVKEGISIVSCGGKDEIDRFYRLYTEFNIPCYVIFDGDSDLAEINTTSANDKKNKTLLKLLGEDDLIKPDGNVKDRYLGFENNFGMNLGLDANIKGLRLYINVKKQIEEKKMQVPKWVTEVRDKILELKEDEERSVLLS